LLADIGVTPLSRSRAVHIEDAIRLCIDQFRRFEVLYLVFRLVTVRAARRRPLEKRRVNCSNRSGVVKLRRLLEKRSADRHLNSIECET
jgi:hypothetical protein